MGSVDLQAFARMQQAHSVTTAAHQNPFSVSVEDEQSRVLLHQAFISYSHHRVTRTLHQVSPSKKVILIHPLKTLQFTSAVFPYGNMLQNQHSTFEKLAQQIL